MAQFKSPANTALNRAGHVEDGTLARVASPKPGNAGLSIPNRKRQRWTGNLYPAYPSQILKEDDQVYDTRPQHEASEISADDPDCLTRTPPHASKAGCLRTYTHLTDVMSFVYITETGEFVQAGWTIQYNKEDENMETLVAKGTILYGPALDIYYGRTYAVPVSEFEWIRPIDPALMPKVKQQQAEALKEFRLNGKLWERLDGRDGP